MRDIKIIKTALSSANISLAGEIVLDQNQNRTYCVFLRQEFYNTAKQLHQNRLLQDIKTRMMSLNISLNFIFVNSEINEVAEALERIIVLRFDNVISDLTSVVDDSLLSA